MRQQVNRVLQVGKRVKNLRETLWTVGVLWSVNRGAEEITMSPFGKRHFVKVDGHQGIDHDIAGEFRSC